MIQIPVKEKYTFNMDTTENDHLLSLYFLKTMNIYGEGDCNIPFSPVPFFFFY